MTARELVASTTLPGRDAEILLLGLLKKNRAWLYARGDDPLDDSTITAFTALAARRLAGEPIAYIQGSREFWSLSIGVAPGVLIPRPDTELLVQWALEHISARQVDRCLDLGTGSGAIALALKSEAPKLSITAVDVSEAALAIASENGERLGLTVDWRLGSWFKAVTGSQWPLIVSNPPYIASDDPHLQQPDLLAEPLSALVSGDDGLDAIRTIVAESPDHLVDGGWLLVEHGWDQGAAVRQLLESRGFGCVETRRDLGGNDRVTGGCFRHG